VKLKDEGRALYQFTSDIQRSGGSNLTLSVMIFAKRLMHLNYEKISNLEVLLNKPNVMMSVGGINSNQQHGLSQVIRCITNRRKVMNGK
jgi:hypothetical protein